MKTEKEKDAILDDLRELAKIHGLTKLSITCEVGGEHLAAINIDTEKIDLGEFFQCVCNIARLYQAGRERIKQILDTFEKP